METSFNKVNDLANSYEQASERVKKGPVGSNFKNLFSRIYKELQDVSSQFANEKSPTIKIKGETFTKTAPGTLLKINNYISELENLQSLSMDLLTKRGSFEDQVSKMVG